MVEREEVDGGQPGRRWSTTGRQNEAATKIQPSDGRRRNEAATWGSKVAAVWGGGRGRWGVGGVSKAASGVRRRRSKAAPSSPWGVAIWEEQSEKG